MLPASERGRRFSRVGGGGNGKAMPGEAEEITRWIDFVG